MKARVYKEGSTGKKVAFLFGKLYDIDENGNAVFREKINIFKFCIETYKGSLSFGKVGFLKLYEFININE